MSRPKLALLYASNQILELTYMFSRSKSPSHTEVVNSLILVTFRIKVFGSHYFKLVVLQGFT